MQRDHVSDVAHILDTNIHEFKEILNSLSVLLPLNKISTCEWWYNHSVSNGLQIYGNKQPVCHNFNLQFGAQ